MLISISNSKNGFQLIVSIVVYARGYFAETIDVIEQHSIGEKNHCPSNAIGISEAGQMNS